MSPKAGQILTKGKHCEVKMLPAIHCDSTVSPQGGDRQAASCQALSHCSLPQQRTEGKVGKNRIAALDS